MKTAKNLFWLILSLFFVLIGSSLYVFEIAAKFCRKTAYKCLDKMED